MELICAQLPYAPIPGARFEEGLSLQVSRDEAQNCGHVHHTVEQEVPQSFAVNAEKIEHGNWIIYPVVFPRLGSQVVGC